ncbi:hypothetical protein [Pilimelia columellifera]|uniref:Uncharacterized protein n=1 Tax=Pilimelia columellifera subsp. columellifera TaxID=706583 RepID=A0ABP6B3H4_9ACTN
MTNLGFRRGAGPALAAAVLLLGALLLIPRRTDWYGSPLLTTAMILQKTAYIAAVCAAVAAAVYPIRHRRRIAALDPLSSRPALHLWAMRTVTLTAWAALGYLVLTAVALAVTATASPGMRLGLANIATGLIILTVAVAFGALAGAIWPRLVTPLLVAVAVHVPLMAGAQHAPTQVRNLFLLYAPAPNWAEPNLTLLLWKLLWAAALLTALATIAAVYGWGARDPRPGARFRVLTSGIAASAIVAAAAVAGMSAAGPVFIPSNTSAHGICHRGEARVCVWDDHKRYLGQLSRMVDAGVLVTGALPQGVTSYLEYGMARQPGEANPVGGQGVIEVGRGIANLDNVAEQLAGQWFSDYADRCGIPIENQLDDHPLRSFLNDLFTAVKDKELSDLDTHRTRYQALTRC